MSDETTNSAPPVIVEERDSIAIVRLNRPAERNSLTTPLLERLTHIVSSLRVRSEISAIVFTGTADVFASGADIRELSGLTPEGARVFALRGQRLMRMIAEAGQMTLAAIDGYCMGGGLDLALACDVRFASPGSIFAHPGARLGIITGWGGTQRLHRLIGTTRAVELFLTTERVGGREALEMGLVDYLSDSPLDRALNVARDARR
ncbi:MAG TPA: enoyl-CoA hydratase/isomerase family protein [Pyrinomonadaceae bacterium]